MLISGNIDVEMHKEIQPVQLLRKKKQFSDGDCALQQDEDPMPTARLNRRFLAQQSVNVFSLFVFTSRLESHRESTGHA